MLIWLKFMPREFLIVVKTERFLPQRVRARFVNEPSEKYDSKHDSMCHGKVCIRQKNENA